MLFFLQKESPFAVLELFQLFLTSSRLQKVIGGHVHNIKEILGHLHNDKQI